MKNRNVIEFWSHGMDVVGVFSNKVLIVLPQSCNHNLHLVYFTTSSTDSFICQICATNINLDWCVCELATYEFGGKKSQNFKNWSSGHAVWNNFMEIFIACHSIPSVLCKIFAFLIWDKYLFFLSEKSTENKFS